MKRIILSVAMVTGICFFCNAQTQQATQAANKTEVQSTVVQSKNDGFKEVKMENLNPKVQEAINKNYATLKVKSLAYNAEKKLTKVTFVSTSANQPEKIVILNEEGKEQK